MSKGMWKSFTEDFGQKEDFQTVYTGVGIGTPMAIVRCPRGHRGLSPGTEQEEKLKRNRDELNAINLGWGLGWIDFRLSLNSTAII